MRGDRRLLLGLLAAGSLLCWAFTARMALQAGGPGHVHAAGLAALFAMWAVMMAGMMIPPEAPVLLQLARARREQLGRSPLPGVAAFLAG